jgi:hypothetical protein
MMRFSTTAAGQVKKEMPIAGRTGRKTPSRRRVFRAATPGSERLPEEMSGILAQLSMANATGG